MDTQVLNTDPDASVQKEAALQSPVALDDSVITSQVSPTKEATQTYGTAAPVGETDHASEIANNMINSDNYNYNSAVDQSKEPTVKTQTVAKGNVSPEKVWESTYTMDDKWKAQEGEDYSWNKLAQERSQYVYDQEATQVLADYAKSMDEINTAAAKAMDTFFSAKYDANQTADKMGWNGGGQETSQDLQVAFLKASTAAQMYSQYEMQEYGLESQLSVARMYAEANMQALALEMYQDEVNRAISEAELTGYYIAPEAGEIMKQQQIAKDILANNPSPEAKKRAEGVLAAGNAYFDDLGFQKDDKGNYIGVETLSNLEYQETVRANKAQEELSRQANNINQQLANLTAQGNQLAWLNFQETTALNDILRYQDASRTYGYDSKTNLPNFVQTSTQGYQPVGKLTPLGGDNYRGVVNGKTVILKKETNSDGTYKLVQTSGSVPTSNKSSNNKTIMTNPYTGTVNPDTKNGVFSNGYQPNNIGGKPLTSTGKTVSKIKGGSGYISSGNVTVDNQTVWQTANGTQYYWDGHANTYKKINDIKKTK